MGRYAPRDLIPLLENKKKRVMDEERKAVIEKRMLTA